MDANVLMTLLPQAPLFFAPDVIDLDPYGSAAVFIDSAIRFIANGGLLCVTCTDMANLCGNHPASTFAKYFSVSVKSTFCHEMAVRILLYSLDLNANRYKRYIVPLLSISVDFYIRVFVRVLTSAEEVKASISRKSYVSVCSICNRFDLFPIANRLRPGVHHATQGPVGHSYCDICRGTTKLAGPVWNASLYDPEFVDLCLEQLKERGQNLATYDRVNGMLNVIKEELVDCPFFYHLDEMFSLVKSPMPKSLLIFSALSRLGYRFSYTHFKKNAFKTDAPAKSDV
ncbi:tRNA (guanine(26)-N(2))-dimethyltransferase [Thelohanellus kitauei]|uniref:tRNA (guanine(26)-N(2))-dimethyltransferase n=1 Tax=Thelohanellus kitauei TaxID=669202 RepID=A0A0C2IZ32_THEKT|nr:tRNA (guanine(26)-N(2))-dimethyltransferase [Thelohanellus kitauei]